MFEQNSSRLLSCRAVGQLSFFFLINNDFDILHVSSHLRHFHACAVTVFFLKMCWRSILYCYFRLNDRIKVNFLQLWAICIAKKLLMCASTFRAQSRAEPSTTFDVNFEPSRAAQKLLGGNSKPDHGASFLRIPVRYASVNHSNQKHRLRLLKILNKTIILGLLLQFEQSKGRCEWIGWKFSRLVSNCCSQWWVDRSFSRQATNVWSRKLSGRHWRSALRALKTFVCTTTTGNYRNMDNRVIIDMKILNNSRYVVSTLTDSRIWINFEFFEKF